MEALKESSNNMAEKKPQFISIQIGKGDVISDYSHNDDYKPMLAFLSAIGIKPDVRTESWCG
ncbi:MAG: hypothetical protein US83_C0007G0027 [Candidatus Falkowbacteria bacterium GW2011_GWC2_38_22]|uniref:Uncharacterized protein n=1 Tax=Candidatus Falkowbacteria bacterium GW2011_GWE1_38_31 TaxID=1618638 RepID=A0A0G0K363_9BACT|nr:MAG: hypothetical protein US73_C0008G0030 [Candidatus Falkowbacteria bacterium GW2011_GWF2_38_1205]KKQ61291.1 MAG: hypothetical protein US83_C0007G0027 [Candidatus Falkowbacteria bacterium GW2011_GWC2_38_22]KKQ63137.1 MAG: hypothetical protein US84_C0008G0030 [Candidatus Falkowbacteria bacterium GW2011_GWF1_38_22]KKQ65334.1 MAG: hypothetical protein US87_C0008G0030 [Candidatus Falkowbacteria bacterium GW2011_GWE2_38_254]KKQ69910.1 MAG: hypothetical protein US91_C0008G0030 [Candidatus Falkowb